MNNGLCFHLRMHVVRLRGTHNGKQKQLKLSGKEIREI